MLTKFIAVVVSTELSGPAASRRSALVLLALFVAAVSFPGPAAGDSAVPPPWSAVHVDGHRVEVWGRRYRFGQSPLPISIQSQGHELFERSPTLTCETQSGMVRWKKADVQYASASHAAITTDGGEGDLTLYVTGRLDYDGLYWLNVELRPRKPTVVTRLDLDLPLRRDQTTLFSHKNVSTRNPANWDAQRGTPDRLYWAGALPREGWRGEFTPQLWIGNSKVGLGWICETPVAWSVGDTDSIIESAAAQAGGMSALSETAPHVSQVT